MSKQSIPLLTIDRVAAGAIAAHRFVSAVGAQVVADANAIGVSRLAAAGAGERIPVDVLGTTTVQAGAAIANGATLKSDANGKAITWAAAGAKLAIALEAAGGADELIEVLLIPNVA